MGPSLSGLRQQSMKPGPDHRRHGMRLRGGGREVRIDEGGEIGAEEARTGRCLTDVLGAKELTLRVRWGGGGESRAPPPAGPPARVTKQRGPAIRLDLGVSGTLGCG